MECSLPNHIQLEFRNTSGCYCGEGCVCFNCVTCGNYISWEHGGIVCDNCKRIYCCDDKCVIPPVQFDSVTKEHIPFNFGQSQGIASCQLCR